jgi:hypothetical protein
MTRKYISIIRHEDEEEKDKLAAKNMHMSVHAWRRLMLNIANGLVPGIRSLESVHDELRKNA